MHIFCVIYTIEENAQNGAYPHLPFSNYCIYACLVNRNHLSGDAVLVIPRYQTIVLV